MSADVRQLRKLAVDFTVLGAESRVKARIAIKKTCIDTKADAQIFVPVDTGFLRSSITYNTWTTKNGAFGEVGPTANYGLYVEMGTSRMAPQPYMRPAFDRRAPILEQILRQMDTGELKK